MYSISNVPSMPTNPLGLRQIQDFDPPKEILVHGVKWSLRKDYRDSLGALPPPRDVKWDDAGSIPMPQYSGKVFWYCMYGTKFPAAGSQERPTRVLYQWFHTIQIPQVNPNIVTDTDWACANVYVADYGAFPTDFFAAMFAVQHAVQQQNENVKEWPTTIDPKQFMKPVTDDE